VHSPCRVSSCDATIGDPLMGQATFKKVSSPKHT
jgi:hypothetical protein